MKILVEEHALTIPHASLYGAIAGCLATLPMSLFMLATQRFLSRGQRYALPPEIITDELAHRTHVKHKMEKKHLLGATTLSHFGYGAVMGSLYGMLNRQVELPGFLKGSLFGVLVWVGSYLVLLPALKMSETGQRESGPRNLMMIVAHLIWGATTGLLTKLLNRSAKKSW